MNNAEYITSLEVGAEQILQEVKFTNYRNQLLAWRLNASFNRSYDESYLWNRALSLSMNGCQILLYGQNQRVASKALRESAQIYENLSATSEYYDKDYALILSALCYDLAGYQANAVCLLKGTEEYKWEAGNSQIDVSSDNYVLSHIRQILLKNIVKANNLIHPTNDIGLEIFNGAISKWYSQILLGGQETYQEEISATYRFYLNVFNIPVSQLMLMLKARFFIYNERSISLNLNSIEHIAQSEVWKKYIRLLANDIYDGSKIKPIEKRRSKFEFWTSQLRAVQKGLLSSDESFVVQMPTSAGKTFIAELSILDSLVKFPDKKCLYISPFRALTNEKEVELSDILSKLGFSVSALSGNYEIDEFQDMVLAEADVLVATPEKIDLLLRINPSYFDSVSLAVVDEGHILGDYSSRSSLLEFLLVRLRISVPQIKLLFISAVMPPVNANQYAVWLSKNSNNVIRSLLFPDSPINEDWEPTRKLIGRFSWSGDAGNIYYKDMQTEDEVTKVITPSFVPNIIRKRMYGGSFPNGTTKAQTSAALAFKLSQDGNTLVFCAQVPNTEQVGVAILALLELLEAHNEQIPSHFAYETDRESYFFARKWYGANSYITKCLSRGIGIHFGDLPEAIRRAVEDDFVRGALKVLISTNTIGQGLNFPIKHLIIHSTIITGGANGIVKIGIRDFWNIMGRAGRAGMETEGQIIFNVKTPTDESTYDTYTNRSNIEPADSMFFKVLRALVAGRINTMQYNRYVKILAEPYILNMIVEESVEETEDEIVQLIINNSLFYVQCIDQNIDITPLRNSFKAIFANIRETISPAVAKVYGETGLSLKGNQIIDDSIADNLDVLNEIIATDNYSALIEIIFELFDESPVEAIESEKLDRLNSSYSDLFPLTMQWIGGADIDQLQEVWAGLNEEPHHLNLLISDGFYFRFPWAISSYITIMLYRLNRTREELPIGITNIVSFIKFGLDNSSACILRSIGIRNRDTAVLIANMSGNLEGRQLIRWVSNISAPELEGLNISKYDKQNILNVSLRLMPKIYESAPTNVEFRVRGTGFEENSRFLSDLVNVGTNLSYKRDPANVCDPFAIEVILGENGRLGYVPRELAKLLSVEIDINSTEYELTVVDIEELDQYSEIIVRLVKIE